MKNTENFGSESGKSLIIIIIVLLLVGGGAYYAMNMDSSPLTEEEVTGETSGEVQQGPYTGPIEGRFRNNYGSLEMPTRKVGEIFEYNFKRTDDSEQKILDEGTVTLKVVAVNGSDVIFEQTKTGKSGVIRKARLTTSTVPFINAREWDIDGKKGSAQITGDPNSIFPLTPTSTLSLRYSGNDPGVSFAFDYKCYLTREDVLQVTNRRYEVIVVRCDRGNDGRIVNQKNYKYLPSLGFYIGMLSVDRSERVSKEVIRDHLTLKSYTPPAS